MLCYAGQMVWLPRLSSKYKPLSLTAIYYSVSTVASILTLVVRERDDLSRIVTDAGPLLFSVYFVRNFWPVVHRKGVLAYMDVSRTGQLYHKVH